MSLSLTDRAKPLFAAVQVIWMAAFVLAAGPRADACDWLFENNPHIPAEHFFQESLDPWGFMQKNFGLARQFEDLPVKKQLKTTLAKMGLQSSFTSHLIRLLRDGEDTVEGRFATALAKNEKFLFKIAPVISTANSVILGEASDVAMWWTFSPYIFFILNQQGISDEEALRKLVAWANTSDSENTSGWLSDRITLAGLEEFRFTYVLNPNRNHITHRFTFQEAQRIVSEVDAFKIEKPPQP